MKKLLPSVNEAEELLLLAGKKNPGPWVEHSRHVARAAGQIASSCGMDPEHAVVMGLLHDIGRIEGVTELHHVLSGYQLMIEKGYWDIAGICLTHSFPIKDVRSYSGSADCSDTEMRLLKSELKKTVYNDYDRLIQLCDALCTAKGVVALEIRLLDVAKRRGLNRFTLEKWKAFEGLMKDFSEKCGMHVYKLFFDEICENLI